MKIQLASIKEKKEAKNNMGAVNILQNMKEIVERYENDKQLSIEEKEELSKGMAKAEAALVGLSEIQQFHEDIKVHF